jgi:hypothetical protein
MGGASAGAMMAARTTGRPDLDQAGSATPIPVGETGRAYLVRAATKPSSTAPDSLAVVGSNFCRVRRPPDAAFFVRLRRPSFFILRRQAVFTRGIVESCRRRTP